MATVKFDLTNAAWTLVAASSVEFLAENLSTGNVKVTYASSTPAADAPYHVIKGGQSFARIGVVGALYARAINDPCTLSVSTS